MNTNLLFFSLFVLLGCTKKMEQPTISNSDQPILTYLALGDSYTIGESVTASESFPYQFAAQLKAQQLNLTTPKIIAKTGWTTDELQAAIKAENLTQTFDFVTLLIGVNNQYRGYSKVTYRKEFKELLQTAIGFAGGNKKRVFVLSIPDWGVTPFGLSSGKNKKEIADEIDAFNAINKEETLAQEVSYTDITPASRNAASDLSLVAKDGLHYSGKMHLQWAAAIPISR
ncbi:MAG: SGNH/GDSL hydrolase family protein [Chitinophagaceae bacterium]|nr:MAG: SGNH/GDSL hydrolase family protein [Chitinophagaceae bacterium]